jgi:hypothetical protein
MRLKPGQSSGRYLVPRVTVQAHYVNLIAPECDVRRGGTYVFIVGVCCAQAVALNAGDIVTQVDFADLLFDKTDVAHVAGRVWAERIDLVGGPGGIRVRAASGRPTA